MSTATVIPAGAPIAVASARVALPAALANTQATGFSGWQSSAAGASQWTQLYPQSGGQRRTLERLLQSAREQLFEYGTSSSFEAELVALLSTWAPEGLIALGELLAIENRISREAAVETLAIVGRTAATGSQESRLELLSSMLAHPLASIRDAAGLALLDLGDKAAIESLKQAAARESHPLVRTNFEEALAELQA